MTEYRHKTTGEVKTQNEWIRDFPNTSFPVVWDQDVLDFINVDPVFSAPQPTPGQYETVRRNGVIQDSNGNWIENWEVVPMFSTYTDVQGTVHTKEQQEAEYQSRLDAEKAKSARDQRDKLLLDTDWIVISNIEKGTEIPTEWQSYRQALRDIPSQAGFPNNIVWPEKP